MSKGKSNASLFVGMSLISLLLIVLVIVFMVIINSSQPLKTINQSIERDLRKVEESKNQLNSLADSFNDIEPGIIDKDELQQSIKNETAKLCFVYPDKDTGKCSSKYNEVNGCCELKPGEKPDPMTQKLDLAKEVATELVVNAIASKIMQKLLKKGLKKAGVTVASRVAVKVAAMSARIAARMGMVAAKTAASASSGPAGWVAGAIMLALEAITMFVDIADVSGYNSFSSNDVIIQMRKNIDYSTQKMCSENGLDYPLLFPITELYPKEFELAQTEMTLKMQETVDKEMEKNPRISDIYDKWLDKAIDNPDTPYPEQLIDFTMSVHKKHHIIRDKIIFNDLKSRLGRDIDKLQFYEFMSTPNRIGISLSEKGANEWNEQKKEDWIKYNDLFKEVDLPPDYENPTLASYTDTYFVLDQANPGDEENPNMIPKKLKGKTVLGTIYGPIVSYCEKERQLGSLSDKIIPTAYGVNFDYNAGICNYTKKYCDRYGMKFKGNDCVMHPGAKTAEMIFGPTITRSSISSWEGRKNDFNSGDPTRMASAAARSVLDPTGLKEAAYKRVVKEVKDTKAKKSRPARKDKCPRGMRDDGTSCWVDSYGRGAGRPLGCASHEELKGGLCYPKCRPGYKSSALECEGRCPSGSKSTGFTCLQGTKSNSHPSWRHRNKCYDRYGGKGYLSRASSACMEPCMEGFKRRSTLLGSAFCDKPRGRYSRAGKSKPIRVCPMYTREDGKRVRMQKNGALCYKHCKSGFTGAGPMCHPKGGAGIKRTLTQRSSCPTGWKNVLGTCWEPCPPGFRDDGATCNKN